MAEPGHGYFFRRAAEIIAGNCAPGMTAAEVAGCFVRNFGAAAQQAAPGLELVRQAGPQQEILQFTSQGRVLAFILCRPAGALRSGAARAAAGAELSAQLAQTGAAVGLYSDGYHCLDGEQRSGTLVEGSIRLLAGRQLAAVAAAVMSRAAFRRLGASGRPHRLRLRLGLAATVGLLAVLMLLWLQLARGGWQNPPAAPPPPVPMVMAHVANAPPGPVDIYRADSGPLSVIFGPAQLMLDSGTQLTAVRSGSEVFLIEGAVTAIVRALGPGEKFSVVTGNATVGVRGTTFRVAYRRGPDGQGYTSLAVIDGTVELTATAPPGRAGTSVTAGQSYVVAGGQPPRRAAGDATHLTQTQLAYLYDAGELARLAREARRAAQARAAGEPVILPVAPPGMQHDAAPGTLHGIDLPTFSGNGTWSGGHGFRGLCSMVIDVAAQKFHGEFTGQGERAGVTGNLAGTFSGNYHGDAQGGDLAGTTFFSVSNPRYRQEVPNLRGQVAGKLRNRLITGSFRGEQVDGEFSIIVRIGE